MEIATVGSPLVSETSLSSLKLYILVLASWCFEIGCDKGLMDLIGKLRDTALSHNNLSITN